jgi:hypothetical protein
MYKYKKKYPHFQQQLEATSEEGDIAKKGIMVFVDMHTAPARYLRTSPDALVVPRNKTD